MFLLLKGELVFLYKDELQLFLLKDELVFLYKDELEFLLLKDEPFFLLKDELSFFLLSLRANLGLFFSRTNLDLCSSREVSKAIT